MNRLVRVVAALALLAAAVVVVGVVEPAPVAAQTAPPETRLFDSTTSPPCSTIPANGHAPSDNNSGTSFWRGSCPNSGTFKATNTTTTFGWGWHWWEPGVANNPQFSAGFYAVSGPAPTSSTRANICVDYYAPDGARRVVGQQMFSAGAGELGPSPVPHAYYSIDDANMDSTTILWHNGTTGLNGAGSKLNYWWQSFDTGTLNCADDGVSAPVVGNVDTPSLLCERAIKDQGNGDFTVDLWGRVLNPQSTATDAMELHVPWQSAPLVTSRVENVLLPPLSTMPAGGWKAKCLVKRTYTGANTVPDKPTTGTSVDTGGSGHLTNDDCPVTASGVDWACLNQYDSGTSEAFVAPGGIPVTSPWITVTAGAGTAAAAKAAAAGLTIGTGGMIAGAAVIGAGALWLADKKGLIDLVPDGCGLMERLGSFVGQDGCPSPQELQAPYLRSQVAYVDVDGKPLTLTQLQTVRWKTAIAVAEVLINPARPNAGKKTVTAINAPKMTTTEVTEYNADAGTAPADATTEGDGCKWLSSWNPFTVIFNGVKCALKWAFVPTRSYTTVITPLASEFPFSAGNEVVTAVLRLKDSVTTGKNAGDSCGLIDVRSILKAGAPAEIGTGFDNFKLYLPTPAESNCPGWSGGDRTELQDAIGNGFGFRVVVRSLMAVGLYVGFLLALVRAFLDEDPEALEPKPA